jgi:hypothetical protein
MSRVIRVSTLAYYPDVDYPTKDGKGIGVKRADCEYLKRAGIKPTPIAPSVIWYGHDEPLVISRGHERQALLSAFLRRNATIQVRHDLDLVVQLNGNAKNMRERVTGEFTLYNGVYRKDDLRKPEVSYTLQALMRCGHRRQVVKSVQLQTPEELLEVAPLVFPPSYVKPQRLYYDGQHFARALSILGIATCDGCIGTASRLLYVAVANALGYTEINITDAWKEFIEQARRVLPERSNGQYLHT